MIRQSAASVREHYFGAIKPCPFCGERAAFFKKLPSDGDAGGEYIECLNGMCRTSTAIIFSSMDDAKPLLAERWNRRT